MITGDKLSDSERGLKVVFAAIDLVTLGQAMAATNIAGLSTKEALVALGKTAGKTIAIDLASGVAAGGVYLMGEELGIPAPIKR